MANSVVEIMSKLFYLPSLWSHLMPQVLLFYLSGLYAFILGWEGVEARFCVSEREIQ